MKISTSIILVAALLVMGTGCTKFDENFNVDPNQPTKASNAQLLTYTINQIPAAIEASAGILYTQQWSEKPYTDVSRYTVVNYDFYWLYSGALMNLKTILDTKEFNIADGSKENQLAVSRILRAWFYWHMTDRWGDIPYNDALMGRENFTPAYNNQKDIYYDLLKELKEAAAQIDEDADPVTGDILFNGDMANWKKFANSMRLLMALRLSKIDAAKGKAEFTDVADDPLIADNSESAVYIHLANAANQNNWYYVFNVQGRQWYWASKTMVDGMKALSDPRLPIFADPAANGSGYNGVPYGLDGNAVGAIPSATVSLTGVHVRTQNAPCYILTYAQVEFALAEGAKINWIGGGDATAEAHYNAGIEASVRQWNRNSFKNYNNSVDAQVEKVPYSKDDLGDITGLPAYMANADVAYTSADALKKIGYQRWLHLYTNGYEAWAEWRRTGFPELTPAPNNNNIPIPRRQAYPVKEQNINGENYNKAVQGQPGLGGKDDLTGRVWWDKQ